MRLFARGATPTDAAAIRWLETEVRQAVADQRGGRRRLEEYPAMAGGWERATGSADHRVVVGGIDGVLLGYLHAVSVAPGLGRVECVYVTPGARGVGLGEALLEHVIADLLEDGATGLEAVALPGDRDTKNLFERFGITARSITLYKSLRV